LLPVIGILVSRGLIFLQNLFRLKGIFSFVKFVVFIVALGITIFSNEIIQGYYFETSPVDVIRNTHKENFFPESIPIANFIASHSTPDDRIQVLGSEPQIYFYSNRLSASGHIYMYGLMEPQKYSKVMQEELISDIERVKPKFIIYFKTYYSWGERPASERLLFKWADPYLNANYDIIGIVSLISINNIKYRWYDELKTYEPESPYEIFIGERKK
jgi:hypothetical protein